MRLSRFGQDIAHVDLPSGGFEMKPAPEDWVRQYIGARGLGCPLRARERAPKWTRWAPANLLCFINGPLTGSEASMSGRWACVTKSPLTGTVTDSHQGGWAGARLRWAGFDGLVFEGRAETPGLRLRRRRSTSPCAMPRRSGGKGIHETVRILLPGALRRQERLR